MTRSWKQAVTLAATAVATGAALTGAILAGENRDVAAAIGLLVLSHLFYLVSCFLFHRNNALLSKRLLIAWAVVVRLIALPAGPSLSQDVTRYQWEGKIQSAGANPYLERPADHNADPRIPGRDFRAGYGPLQEVIQWVGYTDQLRWIKLPAIAFEAATLALLAWMPAHRLVFYAWSPLPVVEFWWNGHNDAGPVFFVVLALALARRERWPWVWMALGAGIAMKWWPAVLVPLLLWRNRRWCWTVALPLFVSAIPYWTPRWRELSDNARFMTGFVSGWRNNDSLYGALLWLAGDVYRAKYAAFAVAALAAVWFARWELERGALATLVTLLLVSANCHPWYLTWLAPLLAWHPWIPLLAWQALMPLGYRVLADWQTLGEWRGSTQDRWFIYAPVFVLMVCKSLWRK